jgi:hypothetical protein
MPESVTLTVFEAITSPYHAGRDYDTIPAVFTPLFYLIESEYDGDRKCPCGNHVGYLFTDDDEDGVAVGRSTWRGCVFVTDGTSIVVFCEDCSPVPSEWSNYAHPVPVGLS